MREGERTNLREGGREDQVEEDSLELMWEGDFLMWAPIRTLVISPPPQEKVRPQAEGK